MFVADPNKGPRFLLHEIESVTSNNTIGLTTHVFSFKEDNVSQNSND